MQITDQKAMHIANYLGKGAFIDKNRDISIQIGDKSEIGINKRGNKYALLSYRGASKNVSGSCV